MKIAIIYDSITGNTELLAKEIAKEVKPDELLVVKKVDEEIPEAELYFIGSWTDCGSCSDKIKKLFKMLHHKRIAYFETAGFKGEDYFERLFMRVKELIPSDNKIIGHYFCQGKMPIATKERYLKMIKANPEDAKLKVSLDNFEEALNHPDEDDLKKLREWVKNCLNNI